MNEEAIPLTWINEHIAWLEGLDNAFSTLTALDIRIMVERWKENNERINKLPSVQPEIVRCCKCSYWDRDSLRYQCNDFRDWNEAECKILAERDPYDEINRYTEADDYCSRAERKHDG